MSGFPVRSLRALEPGDAVAVPFTVTPSQMDAFARLSGDTNPLHWDEAFARERGFQAPVVFGGLIVAQVSRLLGTRLPGPGCVWQHFSFRFFSPLFVGDAAELRATVRHVNADFGVLLLGLSVTARSTRIAEGEAQALLAREKVV